MHDTSSPSFRSRPLVALAALLALYLLSGFSYIPADEQGVLLRFGRISRTNLQPGLHYSIPFPVDRIIRLKVNQAQRLSLGQIDVGRVLGTTDDNADNYLLTGDRNLVQVEASTQFYIEDPELYLFRTEDLTEVLRSVFYQALSSVVAGMDVDSILTTERLSLQNQVLLHLQERSHALRLGIQITTVALENVIPPGEVRDAFLDVANAREDRDRIVQEANGYASEVVPKARGEAQEMLEASSIYKTERIASATGSSERFVKLWEEYRLHRDTTRTRLFLETVETIMQRMPKVILDESDEGNLDLEIFQVQKPD